MFYRGTVNSKRLYTLKLFIEWYFSHWNFREGPMVSEITGSQSVLHNWPIKMEFIVKH